MKCLHRAFVAFALFAYAAPAIADDEEGARAAMRRGVAAFGRGDADAALAEYENAKRLAPEANAPYLYAAEALVQLGRWQDAVANLDAYLAKNPSVSDAEQVRERIARLRSDHFPGRLRITTDAPDTLISVDGADRGPPATLELVPGKHRVEARAPGRKTVGKDVVVVGDAETPIAFELPGADAVVDKQPETRAPTTPSPGMPWRTIGWITTGVGAATLVTAVILDVALLGSKIDDYNAAADRGDLAARHLHADAESLRTGAIAGYVAGAVITGVGIALIVFAPSRTNRASIAPWFGQHLAGVGLTTAF